MVTDDLFNAIVSSGVMLQRQHPDADVWHGICPFAEHPELVDMHAKSRDLAFQPDSPMHPAWRFVKPAMRPAFNVRGEHFYCFGCGAQGGRIDYLRLIGENS